MTRTLRAAVKEYFLKNGFTSFSFSYSFKKFEDDFSINVECNYYKNKSVVISAGIYENLSLLPYKDSNKKYARTASFEIYLESSKILNEENPFEIFGEEILMAKSYIKSKIKSEKEKEAMVLREEGHDPSML
jgi:hypothetical protein